MAISRGNSLTKGLSGMIGGTVVFRQCNGKTIIANRPRKPKKPATENQKASREKFTEATFFAKAILRVPEKKAYYAKLAKKLKVQNAYVAAITMYLRVGPIVAERRYAQDREGWLNCIGRVIQNAVSNVQDLMFGIMVGNFGVRI